MTNKIDKDIESLRSKLFNEASEIKNFLVEVLESKEIRDLAPKYHVQGCSRPHPLFYAGSKKCFNDAFKEEINFERFSGKRGFKIYFERIHLYEIPERYIQGSLFFEKVTEDHDGGFGSYTYNKILCNSKDSEISKFASGLNNQYMIEGGFSYDSDLNKLLPRIGNEAKKITRSNLENCLQEYLIKPILMFQNK